MTFFTFKYVNVNGLQVRSSESGESTSIVNYERTNKKLKKKQQANIWVISLSYQIRREKKNSSSPASSATDYVQKWVWKVFADQAKNNDDVITLRV